MTDDESAAAEPHATAPIDNGAHVVIKILATHMMCGAVLGRAGASIAEIQTGSGCKLQISGSGDFYPGTHDRVMYINGEMLKVRGSVGGRRLRAPARWMRRTRTAASSSAATRRATRALSSTRRSLCRP